MSSPFVARGASLLILSATLVAQIPDGAYVVSSFVINPGGPAGGLFVVDPRVPGPAVAITGLGQDLTGGPMPGGANCVTIREDTGTLLVGELAFGGSVELHEITLAGFAVMQDNTITVGTAVTDGGGISQIALLPGDMALIGVSNLQVGPPLNGALLGIVSLQSGIVTPLPGGPTGNTVNAVATDRTGTRGFYCLFPPAVPATTLFEIPLPRGGTPRQITAFPGSASLVLDHRGQLLSTYVGAGTGGIWTIDPVSGAAQPIAVVGAYPNGLMLERATDDIVYVLSGIVTPGPQVHRLTRSGLDTPLATVSGIPSGVDVRHDPRTYGQATTGILRHAWNVDPNPGGLPRIGTAAFGIGIVTSAPGQSSGILFASLRAGNVVIQGLNLLLDPSMLFFLTPVAANGYIPLPIPQDHSLVGGKLVLQSLHADSGGPLGLAASDGLLLTVLR